MIYRIRTQVLNPYKAYHKLGKPVYDAETFRRLVRTLPGYEKRTLPVSWFIKSISNRFFFHHGEGPVGRMKESMGPDGIDRIVLEADMVISHVFDLLGSGPIRLGRDINWFRDFKSGRIWPPAPHRETIIDYEDDSDIKIIWELSRGYHLVALAKAFRLTGEPRYFREFQDQIKSWIAENPVGYGPNWACTMDVAIRAVNWMCSVYLFFCEESMEQSDFWSDVFASLLNHALFICNNLEVRRDPRGRVNNNNHFMSNVCGLLFLGILFQDLPQAQKWLSLAFRDFCSEVLRQINPDGCDFEASISYHGLVTEMIAVSTLLLMRNRVDVPPKILERLFAAFRFINSYTRPDGKVPQVGDGDDGRFLALGFLFDVETSDHRYLLDLGSEIFDVSFENKNAMPSPYVLWFDPSFLLNRSTRIRLSKTGGREMSRINVFPTSGYYIMRGGNNFTMISTGKVGTLGTGNHTHNNVFSIEISMRGKPIIVDPGTFVYTADRDTRNLFRSTFYHNVIQVDTSEVNSLPDSSVFGLCEEANPEVIDWRVGRGEWRFCGVAGGFRSLNLGLRHQRIIRFWEEAPCWLIHDRLESGKRHESSRHTIKQIFHLHPGVREVRRSFQSEERRMSEIREFFQDIHLEGSEKLCLEACLKFEWQDVRLCLMTLDPVVTKKRLEQGWVSPRYGVREPSLIVVFEQTGEFPIDIKTLIYEIG